MYKIYSWRYFFKGSSHHPQCLKPLPASVMPFGKLAWFSINATRWFPFETFFRLVSGTWARFTGALLLSCDDGSLSSPLHLLRPTSLPPVVGPLAGWPVDYVRVAWSGQRAAVTWMVPFTLVCGTRNRSRSFSISASHELPRSWRSEKERGERERERRVSYAASWLVIWATGPSGHIHTHGTEHERWCRGLL